MSYIAKETITRCPHDKENPYAQVARDLIRDETISPECRWLLVYLLSMKDGWEIKISQIWNHVKNHMGRDKVYRIIEEAIDAGYIKREYQTNGNLRKGCIYYLSETPRFSKNVSDILDFSIPKTRILKTRTLKEEHEEKEEHKKEYIPSPVASELSNLLFNSIKKIKPNFREPNLKTWAKAFDTWMRMTGHTLEDIKKVIDWLPSNEFWSGVILSPKNLRNQFERLELEMQRSNKKNHSVALNETFAYKVLHYFRKIGRESTVSVGPTYIEFVHGPYIKFTDNGFEEQVMNYLRKLNIPIKE